MVRRFGGGETDMKQSDTKQSDMKQSNIGRSVVRLLAAASAAALLLSATVYAGTWSQVGPDGAWTVGAVSYTHLDVYKRQAYIRLRFCGFLGCSPGCGQHGAVWA